MSVDDDHSTFGDGVYLTKLPPLYSKKVLAINNYDGGKYDAIKALKDEKLDIAFEFETTWRPPQIDPIEDKTREAEGRNVHLWPGNHLPLNSPHIKNLTIRRVEDLGPEPRRIAQMFMNYTITE